MKRKLRVSSEDTQPPESASRKSVSELDPLSVYLKQISYNKLLSIEEERELGIKIKKCKGQCSWRQIGDRSDICAEYRVGAMENAEFCG